MTLADEDTNSILADNANRAIQVNVAMQITQSCTNFGTNARDEVNATDTVALTHVVKATDTINPD